MERTPTSERRPRGGQQTPAPCGHPRIHRIANEFRRRTVIKVQTTGKWFVPQNDISCTVSSLFLWPKSLPVRVPQTTSPLVGRAGEHEPLRLGVESQSAMQAELDMGLELGGWGGKSGNRGRDTHKSKKGATSVRLGQQPSRRGTDPCSTLSWMIGPVPWGRGPLIVAETRRVPAVAPCESPRPSAPAPAPVRWC